MIEHLGPTIEADRFKCSSCGCEFLFFQLTDPSDKWFVTSDNRPAFCPCCASPCNAPQKPGDAIVIDARKTPPIEPKFSKPVFRLDLARLNSYCKLEQVNFQIGYTSDGVQVAGRKIPNGTIVLLFKKRIVGAPVLMSEASEYAWKGESDARIY